MALLSDLFKLCKLITLFIYALKKHPNKDALSFFDDSINT